MFIQRYLRLASPHTPHSPHMPHAEHSTHAAASSGGSSLHTEPQHNVHRGECVSREGETHVRNWNEPFEHRLCPVLLKPFFPRPFRRRAHRCVSFIGSCSLASGTIIDSLAARSSIHSRQTDAVRISLDRTAFSFPLVVAVAAPKFSFASHMHLREIQSLPFDSKLRVIVFCFILPSAHYARGCYHSVQRC